VENGKYDSLTEEPWAAMFFPFEQDPDSDTTLVVRSRMAEAELAQKIGRVLAGIDPALPFGIHSWTDGLALVLFPARVATACLGVMGLLAAMLAVTGVFGLAMYSVSKRMREFGIRVALGALPRHVMRSALGRTLILLLAGSAAGLVLGALASRLLAQIVYQTTPRDPVVFVGVIVTMTLLGLIATWVPARRAMGIDPVGLLREE
jgi:ABC-type antimicrobial peptide transport system permease subunit